MPLTQTILNFLKNKQSLFLIGPTNSGKSRFIENELLPFLQDKNFSVSYFLNCNQLPNSEISTDFIIVDEVESLQDQNFLENQHPEQNPYYAPDYLVKVQTWFKKLAYLKLPTVYIITRNSPEEIQNFMQTVKHTDWDNREVACLEFK